MRSWSAAVGLMLLAVTIATGVAVEAFGFAGVGGESHVSYYPGGPPGGTSTPTPFAPPATATPARTKTPTHTDVLFAVDTDLTAEGVQATRPASVPAGGTFTVDVVTFGAIIPFYEGYQVTIDYDDVLFDAVGLPSDWNNTPVPDVSGGTPGGMVVWPSGAICDPNPASRGLVSEDNVGVATIAMTCADAIINELSNYTGMLVELVFTCRAMSGTGQITIHGIDDTFLLTITTSPLVVTQYNDGVMTGSVTCGEGAPASTGTPTPAAPTETPTPSPTHTATPSPTPDPCVVADIDGDGRVTGKDVTAVIRAMRRVYDAAADLNHDGVVDFKDLKLVVNALRAQRC